MASKYSTGLTLAGYLYLDWIYLTCSMGGALGRGVVRSFARLFIRTNVLGLLHYSFSASAFELVIKAFGIHESYLQTSAVLGSWMQGST